MTDNGVPIIEHGLLPCPQRDGVSRSATLPGLLLWPGKIWLAAGLPPMLQRSWVYPFGRFTFLLNGSDAVPAM
jgi:hypothetical protein